MLNADALKFLNERMLAAAPRVIELPDEPDGVYGIVGNDGFVSIHTAKPPRIDNRAADIDTLCRLAAAQAEADPGVEIWHSRARVVAVFNSAEPVTGSRCSLELSPSPQLAMLAKWDQAGGAILSQAELVLLLRTTFTGCAPAELLPAIRGVKATRGAEVQQQISQGKVSMARSVVAEMTGTAAIPERVTFWVPMFAQAAVQDERTIRIEIDPQPEQERFRLVVIPGDIEKAQAEAEAAIGEKIVKALGEGNTIPVYRGMP